MATFVLVHGMWHGGWCWKKVRVQLQAAGHQVYTPTLTGCGERSHLRSIEIDFNTHVRDIVQVLEYEELSNVVLCGHSYGVSVIMAVAGEIEYRLAQLVCLDGPVPTHGQAFKDLYPQYYAQFRESARAEGNEWWVSSPPDWTFGIVDQPDWQWVKSKLTAFPLMTWETPIDCQNSADFTARTYVACMENSNDDEISAARSYWLDKGWCFRALATGHDAMVTQPGQLSKLLLELVLV
jgi:pimeloyl-ACP methyl ester carboxylesterase